MEWPVIVIAAVCAVTAIAVAYMVDVRTSDERKRILSSAPDRPGLPGQTPAYVTGDEVRDAARPVPDSSPDLDSLLLEAVSFPCGWASPDFADPVSKRAVLESPVVLVAESVQYMADLVPVIQAAQNEGTGLVVAAGEIAADVAATLAMNALSGRLACVCVITEDCESLAKAAGASVVPAADLRSGYVPDTVFGHCDLWVSGPDRTWVL